MAQLPEWATVGAKVWIQPSTYGSVSIYRPAVVTRVTKTSVFVKENGRTVERRFVECRFTFHGKKEVRLEEYGSRSDRWSRATYLHGLESETVKQGLAASRVEQAYNRASQALREFTKANPTIDRKDAAEQGITALTDYLDALKGL